MTRVLFYVFLFSSLLFQQNLINGYRSESWIAMFCAADPKELMKLQEVCFPVLHVEVLNTLNYCDMQIRNARSPSRKIDPYFRQICVCDAELIQMLQTCEGQEFAKLNVSYDIGANFAAFLECNYVEMQIYNRNMGNKLKNKNNQVNKNKAKVTKKKGKAGK